VSNGDVLVTADLRVWADASDPNRINFTLPTYVLTGPGGNHVADAIAILSAAHARAVERECERALSLAGGDASRCTIRDRGHGIRRATWVAVDGIAVAKVWLVVDGMKFTVTSASL
jgi:hypothetical protein